MIFEFWYPDGPRTDKDTLGSCNGHCAVDDSTENFNVNTTQNFLLSMLSSRGTWPGSNKGSHKAQKWQKNKHAPSLGYHHRTTGAG